MLENAAGEGLRPQDFDVDKLRAARDSLEASKAPAAQNDFDVHLTYSLVRYISQLCFGRVDPKEINPGWPAVSRFPAAARSRPWICPTIP
jgi:hypothetical protein